jgi:urea ABC transporter ATP-binding protein UrtE
MFEVKSLWAGYGKLPVLHDVSFNLTKGETLVLLGRNGVGKTTLLKSLMGIVKPTSGTIRFNGTEISALRPYQHARAGIAYVPQGRGIFPKLTVEENLLIGLRGRTDDRTTIPDDILDMFPILRERMRQLGGTFSGGQQQQLGLARALCGKPDLLLLDEPSEGIQPSIVLQIAELLRMFNRDMGLTVLLVEQNLELARKTASRCLVMAKGRVSSVLTKEELDDESKVFATLAQ